MDSGGVDQSFSALFSTLGYELSHILVSSISHTINASSMTNASSMSNASQFIHWLRYDSPISPMNIHGILSFVFDNYLQYHSHHTFSMAFPALLGNQLLNELVIGIPPNVNNFSITNASEFFEWLNYDSPISSINIHQTVASAYDSSLLYLYPQQPSPITYEDLVVLQEHIGHVSVGLTEKTISMNLKTTTLIPSSKILVKDESEICVVCQDEYKLHETIGTLQCRHIYHENCIKQWLLQKNVCPICKATALVDLDKDSVE